MLLLLLFLWIQMMSCDAGAGVCFFFSNMYVHIPDHLSFNEGKRLVRPWKKSENPPPPTPPAHFPPVCPCSQYPRSATP